MSLASRHTPYLLLSLSLSFRFAAFVPFFLRFLRAWHRRSPLSNLPCLHPPRVLHVPDFGGVIWCPVFPVFFQTNFCLSTRCVGSSEPPPPSFFVDWFSRRLLRLLHLLLFASSFFLSFFTFFCFPCLAGFGFSFHNHICKERAWKKKIRSCGGEERRRNPMICLPIDSFRLL